VLYVAPEHPEGKQVISEDIATEATGIMVGDVTEGIAKDASLGDRPVAGKTGTSDNFFDAWFIGFTPELVTGTWMGYAEGGQTLEYVLDYARRLHGLSGGITPAEIWKTYTKVILSGEPVEQFDGVEIPERADPAAAPKPRVKYDPDAARRHASASPEARRPAPEPRRGAAAASASASSVSPSGAREPRAKRAGAARYSSASSSASVAPR
jgi:penicillin-binding protein 1A